MARKCPRGVKEAGIWQTGTRSAAKICHQAGIEIGGRTVFGTCQIKSLHLPKVDFDDYIEENYRNHSYMYLTKGLRHNEPQKNGKCSVEGEYYKQTI